MNNIAAAIIEDLQKLAQDQKIVKLEDLKQSEHLLEKMAEDREDQELQTLLKELDPSFILYMNMIECLMIISTIIRKHPTLEDFNNRVAAAEKSFCPGTWDSTVTESFFNMWVLFDVKIQGDLTLAGLCLQVAKEISSVKKNLYALIEKGLSSRVGIYNVHDRDDDMIYFKELITGKQINAICPTGYMGQPGETWLVRLFPPLDGESFIIVTTPYCICNTDSEDWDRYFEEKGIRPDMNNLEKEVDRFFRKSAETPYWLSYIRSTPPTLETEECIHISGIPKATY